MDDTQKLLHGLNSQVAALRLALVALLATLPAEEARARAAWLARRQDASLLASDISEPPEPSLEEGVDSIFSLALAFSVPPSSWPPVEP